MAVFNEIAAAAYLYIMMLLTDFWGENDLSNSVGWALLVFLIFVVSVNFLKVSGSLLGFLTSKLLSIWRRYFPKETVPMKPMNTEFDSKNQTNKHGSSFLTMENYSSGGDLLYERQLINNSFNPTVSLTNLGRQPG